MVCDDELEVEEVLCDDEREVRVWFMTMSGRYGRFMMMSWRHRWFVTMFLFFFFFRRFRWR